MRWWIKSERSQEITSRARIVQAIKKAFDANDIDPTDPQLIYYQNKAPAFAEGRDMEAEKQTGVKASYGPPPDVVFSKGDPEAKKQKLDSKKGTMLPEH